MIATGSQWTRLLLGLLWVFILFQWLADGLGSDLGQAGLIVGAVVVAATLATERVLFPQTMRGAAASLGLGWPAATGIAATLVICAMLLVVVAVFVRVTGAAVGLHPNALSLLPGLFAQGGVAEEILFRGYLYAHLRRGRSFWRATALSILPFAGVHLLLFFTMPWPVALAALLLSVVMSIPLAHLFELGGNTLWAPALLHFVVQGTVKILVIAGVTPSLFSLVWMAASATLPMLALWIARPATRPSH